MTLFVLRIKSLIKVTFLCSFLCSLCLINDVNYAWTKKGCTLNDKTAFEEFGLAQNDIKKAFWGSFDLTDSINSHTATRVLP